MSSVIEHPISAKTTTINNSFSLCTWNLNKKCGTSRWGDLFPQFHELYSPDFYLFQEMDYHPERCDLFANHGLKSAFLPNLRMRFRSDTHSGVATLSRWRGSEHVPFLTEHKEPLLKTPKATLVSLFPLEDGRELLIVNIHGINFVRAHKFAHQIETMRDLLVHHNGPVIIAGDFNTWNRTRVKHVEDMLEHLGHLELTAVHFGEHQDSVKHAPALLHHFYGAHPLDRIYFSARDLEVSAVPFVPDSIDDEAIDISDHMPLLVEFRLKMGEAVA